MHTTHTHKIHPAVGVALLMLVGLALRIWFVSVNELDPTNSPADDGDYYQRALRFATTGQYMDDFWLIRPPLHVFLFAVMLRISIIIGTIPGLTLVRAAQITLSIVSIPIGYDLARRLFGQRTGLIFAAILAIWYPLIELPTHLFTEPLFIMLLLTHLWLLIVWRDERRWSLLVLSGIFLGLTALTRSVGVYGAPFVVLWLVLTSLDRYPFNRNEHKEIAKNAKPPRTPRPAQYIPGRNLHQWVGSLVVHMRQHWLAITRQTALFVVPMALVILPWTVRNYIVYQRVILIDTIGSVNLWLHMEKYDEKGVEIIRQLPQRDRHVFAVQDTRRMFFDDPVHFWSMLWRNAWLHFLHIWKAQFIEDFLLKISFYGRPLRTVWPLGMFGDGLWFVFTAASLAALARPLRDGAFRWVALCWAAYTMLTVMLFHLEPRYLMPLWLVCALYGSWGLATLPVMFAQATDSKTFVNRKDRKGRKDRTAEQCDGHDVVKSGRPSRLIPSSGKELDSRKDAKSAKTGQRPDSLYHCSPVFGMTWHDILAIGLVGMFLLLFGSYRNYPETLLRGYERESHRAAGVRAYAAGDFALAVQEFDAMLAAHPTCVSSQAELGLALIANQQYDEADTLLGTDDAQHILVARGELARARGDFDQAATLLTRAEKKSGDTVQHMAMQWMQRTPTYWLTLGNGQDFGYIEGFSWAEESSTSRERPYRWLQGHGHSVMPLPQPLTQGSMLALRMTGGREQPVPLHIALAGAGGQTHRFTPVQVASGQWRIYRVLLPDKFSNTQKLDITLDAPVVLPAHLYPGTNDIRPVSLMVNAMWVR